MRQLPPWNGLRRSWATGWSARWTCVEGVVLDLVVAKLHKVLGHPKGRKLDLRLAVPLHDGIVCTAVEERADDAHRATEEDAAEARAEARREWEWDR